MKLSVGDTEGEGEGDHPNQFLLGPNIPLLDRLYIFMELIVCLKSLETKFDFFLVIILDPPNCTEFLVNGMTHECHTTSNELAHKNKVELVSVECHEEIGFNEEADTEAKKGADTPFIGPAPCEKKSLKQIKKDFGEKIRT